MSYIFINEKAKNLIINSEIPSTPTVLDFIPLTIKVTSKTAAILKENSEAVLQS